MSKRPEITLQTKKNLIKAFFDLVLLKNFDKISVKEITDHAGYYRSTFYEYFTNINDLLEQIENNLIHDIKIQAKLTLNSKSTLDLITYTASFYESNSQYIYILLSKPVAPTFESKVKNTLRPIILEHFNLNEKNSKNEYIVEFALSALIGSFTYWYDNNKNITLEELTSIINPLVKGVLEPII